MPAVRGPIAHAAHSAVFLDQPLHVRAHHVGQADRIEDFEDAGVNGVAAEVAREGGMRFEQGDRHAAPRQRVSRMTLAFSKTSAGTQNWRPGPGSAGNRAICQDRGAFRPARGVIVGHRRVERAIDNVDLE